MHASYERLSLDQVEKRLKTIKIGRSACANEVWDSLESTNTRVSELAAAGAPEGVFVAARQQMAGRGRLGRTWISQPDAGIYLSVLLRPGELAASQLAPITLAIGVAVARAVEYSAGVRLGLKWVNDLVFEGRKVGGILAEMSSYSKSAPSEQKALVIGIGLNLKLDPGDIPEELKEKIDWLEQIAAMPLDPNEVAARVLFEVEQVYDDLQEKRSEKIISEWRARSVTLGREIVAVSGNSTISGVAVDVDHTGALCVRMDDGQMRQLHAGEITIRSVNGKYV